MTSKWLKFHDEKMHVVTEGDPSSSALVLLHGFTGSTATWQPLSDEIRDQFYVVRIDLWGHGRSSSPENISRYTMTQQTADLETAFSVLGLQNIILAGYSMGGRIALGYAAAYPDRLAGLILESSSPGLRTEIERTQRIQHDASLASRLRKESLSEFMSFWENIPLFESQKQMSDLRKATIKKERLSQNPVGLAKSLEGIGTGSQPSYWQVLPKLNFPVLLVTGTLDTKFTQLANEMAKQFPNCVHNSVENAGHAIHVEKPREFATIIESFTAQHLSRGGQQ